MYMISTHRALRLELHVTDIRETTNQRGTLRRTGMIINKPHGKDFLTLTPG
jgi:hypothetical protein